jgi:repressor LexA
MAISMTHKQAELLAYLKEYIADNDGIAPSFEEMKDAIGLRSKSGIYRLIAALEERGKITRICNRSRAIRVLPEDPFSGIPTFMLVAELARRGEVAAEARKAA